VSPSVEGVVIPESKDLSHIDKIDES